ncbi:hypothetical protein KCH_57080 [Kitasatospora cheerisanensis KCTC 2395]|uniref:Uncharacterized protein n=1 Tax=Kitasatospora cheerisanensis KCTC 2395 TaxID=1348663 RepID=A0A066YX66_9ACTN|nr:hypothetical protein KCH_57080 [Kitasatospora cheerisanensis KCTC 2395]
MGGHGGATSSDRRGRPPTPTGYWRVTKPRIRVQECPGNACEMPDGRARKRRSAARENPAADPCGTSCMASSMLVQRGRPGLLGRRPPDVMDRQEPAAAAALPLPRVAPPRPRRLTPDSLSIRWTKP